MKRLNNYRERLFADAAGSCIYCGHPLTLETMEIDHIVPGSKGGTRNYDNLVCSCPHCNALKGDKDVREFIDSMPPKKQISYENRLMELFMQGKLSARKWDLLDPIVDEPQTDRMAVCAPWQIICYLCSEFF
ncbi:MAG: HNH endonuclease [Bacteroidales bacterium]|nr:HNH endonuclease [Bacteroidales bacterium]